MVNSKQEELPESKIEERTKVDLSSAQDYVGADYVEITEPVNVTIDNVEFEKTGKTGKNISNDNEFGYVDCMITFSGGPFEKPSTLRYGGIRCYDENRFYVNLDGKKLSHVAEMLKTMNPGLSVSEFMKAMLQQVGKTVVLNGKKTFNPNNDETFLKPIIVEFLEE